MAPSKCAGHATRHHSEQGGGRREHGATNVVGGSRNPKWAGPPVARPAVVEGIVPLGGQRCECVERYAQPHSRSWLV